jgi:hypothetical protein
MNRLGSMTLCGGIEFLQECGMKTCFCVVIFALLLISSITAAPQQSRSALGPD